MSVGFTPVYALHMNQRHHCWCTAKDDISHIVFVQSKTHGDPATGQACQEVTFFNSDMAEDCQLGRMP